jgi:hypothetical protein
MCQCKLDLNGRKDHGDWIGDWNLSLEILLIISRSEEASRSIPVFKEGNGFWYIYYVMAHDQSGGAKEVAKGNVHRMLLDTGANYNLDDAKHVCTVHDEQSQFSAIDARSVWTRNSPWEYERSTANLGARVPA